MRALLATEQLAHAMQTVSPVACNRKTLPILGMVLVWTAGDRIHFKTTDLDLWIETSVDGQIDREGGICVSAQKLSAIAANLPIGELELAVEGQKLFIEAKGSQFKMHGLPVEEFPMLPKIEREKSLTISQASLRRLLHHTNYCLSDDESRYILNSLLFQAQPKALTLVGTDGRRLAIDSETPKFSAAGDFVLPDYAVSQLMQIVGETGECEIQWTDKECRFSMLGLHPTVMQSKVLDGKYPMYQAVFPKSITRTVTVNRHALHRAVVQAGLMTDDKHTEVILFFDHSQIELHAGPPEERSMHAVECQLDGEPLVMAFNPGFMADALNAIDAPEIAIELLDELSPAIIKAGTNFQYILMPLRKLDGSKPEPIRQAAA